MLTVKLGGMNVNMQTSTHSHQHTTFQGEAEENVYEQLCEQIRQLEAQVEMGEKEKKKCLFYLC